MSDYLFSSIRRSEGELSKAISDIYSQDPPRTIEYHGDWGSLAVSVNHYHGFLPYETHMHLLVVIGGPVLYFRDNDFLTQSDSNVASASIYQRWIVDQSMTWDEDLSGPFTILLIDKSTRQVTVVTDLMAFIPVYVQETDKQVSIGTHIDALARACALETDFDQVSLADFVLNGVVTYPYTVYRGIRQAPPASTVSYNLHFKDAKSYWVPVEQQSFATMNAAAAALSKGISGYVARIAEKMEHVAQFISAGEDSRALAGILPKRLRRDAFIFLDKMNREGKIAKKVSKAYEANFIVGYRDRVHYLKILPEASKIIGAGQQYIHAHSLNFNRDFNLNYYGTVFGGFLSDTLLKGHHVKLFKGYGRLPFLPQIASKKCNVISEKNKRHKDFFEEMFISEIFKRREDHLKFVRSIRPKSCHEWFNVWPLSMHSDMPYLYSSRRLFRSYEPFMCKEAVKIGASVPTSWKLNHRLFRRAMKPYLRKSKWIMHADGRLPYFGLFFNVPVQFVVWSLRFVARRIGLFRGNQGPWGDWNSIFADPIWDKTVSDITQSAAVPGFIKQKTHVEELLQDATVPRVMRINLLQVLWQCSRTATRERRSE